MSGARAAAWALALAAGPAAAQDLAYSFGAYDDCVSAGGTAEACVLAPAEACIEATEGGDTTAAMGGCYERARLDWDDRLNRSYAAAISAAERVEAEAREGGWTQPPLIQPLREMQRAWIPFRDAACAFELAQWGGGTGGGPATGACLAAETGRQALRIEAFAERYAP